MIALRESDRLTVHDLPPEYRHTRDDMAASAGLPAAEPAAVSVAGPVTAPCAKPDSRLNPFECAEREVLLQELKRQQWNLSGVAREFNISRNTLYRKLQRLNIEHPDKSRFH